MSIALTILGTCAVFVLDISTILWLHNTVATNGFWQVDPKKMYHIAEYGLLGILWIQLIIIGWMYTKN